MGIQIKSFGGSRRSGEAFRVRMADGRRVRLLRTERDADGTEENVQTRLRNRMRQRHRTRLHVHKNRDGSFTYVLGKRPRVWPEDEE